MNDDVVYLTPEGRDKLERELKELIQVRRPQIAEMIRNAKEDGDVMENAAYDEAKDQQAFIEGRIMHLEDLLKRSYLIEAPNGNEAVGLGCVVTVSEGRGKPETYHIVGSAEADPAVGRISNESPLGQALMGQRVGASVSYRTPDGETLTFKIISIG